MATVYGTIKGYEADAIVGTGGSDKILLFADAPAGGGRYEVWDTFTGKSGHDIIYGLTKSEILRYQDTSNPVPDGGNAMARIHQVELIDIGNGNDILDMSARAGTKAYTQNITLFGGQGDDQIIGGAGSDLVRGGPGTDILKGGPGNDVITGFDGNDTINGQAGNDTLYGEKGSDRFVFDQKGFGNDKIVGFVHGQDKVVIDIAGVDRGDVDIGGGHIHVDGGGDISVNGSIGSADILFL